MRAPHDSIDESSVWNNGEAENDSLSSPMPWKNSPLSPTERALDRWGEGQAECANYDYERMSAKSPAWSDCSGDDDNAVDDAANGLHDGGMDWRNSEGDEDPLGLAEDLAEVDNDPKLPDAQIGSKAHLGAVEGITL